MDSVLRPRDIQARIRAGESPEDVAAAAQTSVDRIMGFATPVLAERAYQAELAQKASVRRRTGTGPVGHLGQAVEAFLEPHGLGADDVEWDAWRREDGRWTVLATYLSGAAQQTARFTFDTGGRFVVADNDEARTLVGERTAEEPAPAPAQDAEALAADAPAAPADGADTPDTVPDDQLSLGDDTLGMVLGRPATPEAPARPAPPAEPEITEDLTSAAAALRPGAATGPSTPAGTGDADWIVTQASERPARPEPVTPVTPVQPAAEAPEAPEAPEPPVAQAPPTPAPEEPVEDDEHFEEALFAAPAPEAPAVPEQESAADDDRSSEPEEQAAKQPARASRGRGRASVPSWDEIMFGTPKD